MRRPFARALYFTVGAAQSDFFSVCPCFAGSGSDVGVMWSFGGKVKVDKWIFHSVISPAMGGILVGHEVARHLGRRHIFAEKTEGKLGIRRFEVKPGEKFLVAEDVITTGSAVQEVIERVKEAGGEVVGVACLVDRSETKPKLGVPICSLLSLPVETFSANSIPEDLQKIPAIKPGSR